MTDVAAPFPPLLPVVVVSGTHREVGRQIGAACAESVRRAVRFNGAETPRDGRTLDAQLELAEDYRAVTAAHLPYLVEELDGVAEAAEVDPVRVFAASIEEIWAPGPATAGPGGRHGERGRCSDLVAGPPATAAGDVLVAHTNDLEAQAEPDLVAVDWRIEGEPRILTVGIGPWISVGWNDAGLLLSGNELAPNDDRVGVPRLLLVREQLRHTTMRGAIGAALHPARASAYNTVFALPDGEVANVEGSATDGVVTTLGPDGTLVHTNHYVCPAMLRYEDDPAYATRSARRFTRGTELLAEAAATPGTLTEQRMTTMLADHENAPDSLCRHPSATSTTKTVFWCVTNVSTGAITFGRGNPCHSRPQSVSFAAG